MNGPAGLQSHMIWIHNQNLTIEEILTLCDREQLTDHDAELIWAGEDPVAVIDEVTVRCTSPELTENESYAATVAKAMSAPFCPLAHPLYAAVVHWQENLYLLACDVCGATAKSRCSFQTESRFMIGVNGLHTHRARAHPEAHRLTKQELLEKCIANTGGAFSAEDTQLILQGQAPRRNIAKVEHKAKATQAASAGQSSHRASAEHSPETLQTMMVLNGTAAFHEHGRREPSADASPAYVHTSDDRQKRRRRAHPPGWYAQLQYGGGRQNSSESWIGSSQSL